jgi:hypothetical protein
LETSLNNTVTDFNSTLADLEHILYQKAMEWAREMYRNILKYLDDKIKKLRDKSFAIIRLDETWHTTMLGEVRVKRRYYRDRDGTYHYLLDELLGMGKHRHITRHVHKLALDMVGVMPFRRSADILAKTTPVKLSHQTIHRMIARVADYHLEKQDNALEWFRETGELTDSENKINNSLFIEADGVMLSLQREKTRKTEAKLGIAYEGREKIGKDRFMTVNKSAYADIVNGDAFWSAMTLKLSRRYDLSGTSHMVLGGDGAGWIRKGVDYFGADYQLCRFHLNRNLTRTLGHDRETLKEVKEALNKGNISDVFNLIDKAADSATGDTRKNIKKLYSYLKANLSGLKTYPRRDNKSVHTGAIEGNIDKFVAGRMKNQGMSWSIQGIRRMLWLRIALYEDKLDDYLEVKVDKPKPYTLSEKTIRRVVDKKLKRDYTQYFNAGLPALAGPHSSKPWVKMLKSIVGGPML